MATNTKQFTNKVAVTAICAIYEKIYNSCKADNNYSPFIPTVRNPTKSDYQILLEAAKNIFNKYEQSFKYKIDEINAYLDILLGWYPGLYPELLIYCEILYAKRTGETPYSGLSSYELYTNDRYDVEFLSNKVDKTYKRIEYSCNQLIGILGNKNMFNISGGKKRRAKPKSRSKSKTKKAIRCAAKTVSGKRCKHMTMRGKHCGHHR